METNKLMEAMAKLNNYEGTLPFILLENPNNLAERKVDILVSRSGIPCLFECGGAYSHTGYARIITSASGNEKKPLLVRTHGDRACKDHALLGIENSLVFEAVKTKITVDTQPQVVIRVYKVEDIDITNRTAKLKPILYTGKRHPVIAAGIKACHYHCRDAYYIRRNITED